MKLRPIIFWLHLAVGVTAGLVIAILSLTGAVLAFEKEIVAWAERDLRQVVPPANATPLALDDVLERAQQSQSGQKPSGLTIARNSAAAVTVNFGRTNAVYVNPYTGDVRSESGSATRRFMQLMLEWHRWLGRGEQSRAAGKGITGAVNVAFLLLAVSGLFLWWPRAFTIAAFGKVLKFNLRLRGRARDWNWHTVIGFWTAPVLILVTITAVPISYKWANDAIYKVAGSSPPAPPSTPSIAKPSAGAARLPLQRQFALVQESVPDWQTITFRFAGGGGGRGEGPAANRAPRKEAGERGVSPLSVMIKQQHARPRFSSIQLTLDPFSGQVLRRESYADSNLGRRIRSWSRFLHTGEALGWIGQTLAFAASLGALVLVYTGFALAWRRFFARNAALDPAEASETGAAGRTQWQSGREVFEPSMLAVATFILWTSCLAVGAVGLVVPYRQCQAPSKQPMAPVEAQLVNVELGNDVAPTAGPRPAADDQMTPPPLADMAPLPSAPALQAVAEPSATLAFSIPVEGPVRIVEASQAMAHRGTTEPQPDIPTGPAPPVQALVYGQGEGKQPAPDYPARAMREGQEGTVRVQFYVDENGRVQSAESSAPSPWRLLNDAAVRAVRERWRFRPGTARRYEVAIHFQLTK